MKKIIVFLLTALLMFSVAFADSVPMSKEDQMASLVKNFLEENEFPYEYDDYTFTVPFSVDNSMEYAFITVYIYDDMLSVSVDAPITEPGRSLKRWPCSPRWSTTRSTMHSSASIWMETNSISPAAPATWWRNVSSPQRTSCSTCFAMPHSYMEDYATAFVAVLNGGDPYEAFETCQTAVDAQ